MKSTALAIVFCCISIGVVFAQGQIPDEMLVKHKSYRNMLGLLAFCQSRGVSEPGAPEYLREITSVYDDLIGSSKGDEAEAVGRQGVLSGFGLVKPIEDVANEEHQSVDDICRQFAGFYKRQADRYIRPTGQNTAR
ncbi:hypothetical protein [Rhizobium sp. CF142]|uniref:hypothetical protein n=1 Tax=Rhizobium sp. CF142 TaxID=1144314 RepID=UPI00026EF42E|nr:hypothetical protein [Rhizobium sp. CF142]EJJ30165.1 hypothetical protein PMI11_01614 [Rhizobium sp. CF142]